MNAPDQPARSRTQPYSGYYNRPQPDTDTTLTAVGPGTPCGDYMRRYWHPFMLASELGDLPKAVRLLGEDLVVFRDKTGRLGLLHRHCVHRGTSLEYGIVTDRGLQCCYHGWHFDVTGKILETPAEPPTSRIAANFSQGAYAIRELHGLFFAYMGPPELEPPLPILDTFGYPKGTVSAPFKMNLPCNWLQIVENAADPIHNAFLHAIVTGSGQQFSDAFKVLPELDFPETPLGFLSMATRKIGDHVFIRSSDMIMPNVGQFPAGTNLVKQEAFGMRPIITRWAVPLDDTHSVYIGIAHLNEEAVTARSRRVEDYGVDKFPLIGQTADRPYDERQREPGDYDAVASQGAVANRKAEHLGTTDRGVVLFRRMLAKSIASVRAGEVPEKPRAIDLDPVPTFAHEVVVKLPSEQSLEDPQALAEFGRRVAEIYVEIERLPKPDREREAAVRIRDLVKTMTASA